MTVLTSRTAAAAIASTEVTRVAHLPTSPAPAMPPSIVPAGVGTHVAEGSSDFASPVHHRNVEG